MNDDYNPDCLHCVLVETIKDMCGFDPRNPERFDWIKALDSMAETLCDVLANHPAPHEAMGRFMAAVSHFTSEDPRLKKHIRFRKEDADDKPEAGNDDTPPSRLN